MKSYVTNRKQIVELRYSSEIFTSQTEVIRYGIPQGSILGPLLFICFINDLVCNVDEPEIVLFADDVTVPITADTGDTLRMRTKKALTQTVKWFRNNKLHINIGKTCFIKFRTKNKIDSDLRLNIDNINIEHVKDGKFLGVYIDESLSWTKQCAKLCKTLNKFVYMFLKLKYEIPFEALKNAYFTLFESILRYGIIFWGTSSALLEVFKIQKRVLRIIDGKPPLYPCRDIFKRQKIMSLPSLYIYEVLIFFQRHIFTLEMLYPIHDHNTRSSLIRKKRTKLALTDQHLRTKGIDFFNKLPLSIREVIGGPSFKNKLKKYLIESVFYTVGEFF